jgi:hypothetical protein
MAIPVRRLRRVPRRAQHRLVRSLSSLEPHTRTHAQSGSHLANVLLAHPTPYPVLLAHPVFVLFTRPVLYCSHTLSCCPYGALLLSSPLPFASPQV